MLIASALAKARKLKGRSLAELRFRGAQAAFVLLERFAGNASAEPTDDQFRSWLVPSSIDGSLELEGFPQAEELGRVAEFACRSSQPWVETTILAAEQILRGKFDLLGYEGLSFGAEIDWHLDPVANKRSPRNHWSRIPFLDPTIVGDHKVVWEINRHHHLVLLGRAYRLTRDEKYAWACAQQLEAWMNSNPPKVGINWASSLEVSYRLIAWIWCLRFFEQSTAFDARLRRRLLKFAHVHATHVERYLSTYFSPNTHLTGEALGLLYAGNAMPFFRRAQRWKELGWSILEAQLPRQVYPDGVYFEQASYYQRYTIDIYTHAILIARAAGRVVPPSMLASVHRLVDFLSAISRPDGSIPLIGDDDGGQLVRLEERECADVRATFASASLLLSAPWYGRFAATLPEESLWLFGIAGAASFEQEKSQQAHPPASRLFADGGYAVMRDGWDRDSSSVVVDCGPLGTANGGHGHADSLAMLVTVSGQPLFVDPGTFTYTTDLAARNSFRDSRAHNTVVVDDMSSSVPSGPFTWNNMAKVTVDAFHDSGPACFFAGRHDGYGRLRDPVLHQRRVLFLKKKNVWLIWDVVEGTTEHTATAAFQCAAAIEARPRGVATVDFFAGDQRVACMTALGDVTAIVVATSRISECYGTLQTAPVCRATSIRRGRHDLLFVITADDGHAPAVSARRSNEELVIDVVGASSADKLRLLTGKSADHSTKPAHASLVWLSGSSESDLQVAGSWNPTT
jgi:hypothetical protein